MDDDDDDDDDDDEGTVGVDGVAVWRGCLAVAGLVVVVVVVVVRAMTTGGVGGGVATTSISSWAKMALEICGKRKMSEHARRHTDVQCSAAPIWASWTGFLWYLITHTIPHHPHHTTPPSVHTNIKNTTQARAQARTHARTHTHNQHTLAQSVSNRSVTDQPTWCCSVVLPLLLLLLLLLLLWLRLQPMLKQWKK